MLSIYNFGFTIICFCLFKRMTVAHNWLIKLAIVLMEYKVFYEISILRSYLVMIAIETMSFTEKKNGPTKFEYQPLKPHSEKL